MKTKVLVTGGAGFLGSHLCESLLNNNYDVLCIDNYSTGSKDNIEELLNNPFFEATRHEVTMPFYTEVDQIYNLLVQQAQFTIKKILVKLLKHVFMEQ